MRTVGSCGDGTALTLASSRMTLDPLCRWETLSTVHLSQQCPRFSSRAPPPPHRPRENLPTKCFHPSQDITVAVSPHTMTPCLRGKVVVFARCPQALSCPQALAAQACQERSVKAFYTEMLHTSLNCKVNINGRLLLLCYMKEYNSIGFSLYLCVFAQRVLKSIERKCHCPYSNNMP